MAPEKAPAFQFYPKDFLTDGRVAAMSLEECGAYIKLLCICWTESALPTEPKRLAQMIGCTPAAFARVWPAIRPCFSEGDGVLRHGRLDKERQKKADFNARQKAKAERRWHRSGNAVASSGHIPESSQEHALHSPVSDLQSPIKEKTNTARVFPINGTTDPEIGERAAWFLERYAQLYPEHRKGARFLPKPALDWTAACELVAVWPNERLEKLAIVFLKTDHEFAANGSRTIRQFAALASWCDDRLRQVEAERGRHAG